MDNFKKKLSHFFLLDETDLEETDDQVEVRADTNTVQTSTEPALVRKQTPKVEKVTRKQSGGENVVAINQKQALQKSQITIIEPRL